MNDKFYTDLALVKKDSHQWDAYNSNANTVVIAGPGSGKTRILALKAILLIDSKIFYPSGIACISYSRETVREIEKRLDQYGYVSRRHDFIGTVHGFCLSQIIRPYAKIYPEYNIRTPLKIASKEVTDSIYQEVLRDLKMTPKSLSLTNIEKERYNDIVGISKVVVSRNSIAVKAAQLFEEKLEHIGCLDFVSIIKIATRIIQEKDYVKRSLECKFPWILIDEYQDLGRALHEMVLTLQATTDIKIYVVGDMNQSIYGFQGGYPEFLQELDSYDEFVSIHLLNNYRSSQHIIDASLAALAPPLPIPDYKAKSEGAGAPDFTFIVCESEIEEQCLVVARKIIPTLSKSGLKYNDIGVIVASNADANLMSILCSEEQIPSYISRWNFDRTDLVRWLEDCAKWCRNKRSFSFEKLYRFWRRLLLTCDDKKSLWEDTKIKRFFYDILESSVQIEKLSTWLDFIFSSFELQDILVDSEFYSEEWANLSVLYRDSNVGALKDYTVLRLARLGQTENEVTVTTRHSAKGLEFEVVILLGMDEDKFPNYYTRISSDPKDMQEAHRLCYVCVSRAKKSCYLLRSKTYSIIKNDGEIWVKPHMPSRFWNILFKQFGNKERLYTSDNYPNAI